MLKLLMHSGQRGFSQLALNFAVHLTHLGRLHLGLVLAFNLKAKQKRQTLMSTCLYPSPPLCLGSNRGSAQPVTCGSPPREGLLVNSTPPPKVSHGHLSPSLPGRCQCLRNWSLLPGMLECPPWFLGVRHSLCWVFHWPQILVSLNAVPGDQNPRLQRRSPT